YQYFVSLLFFFFQAEDGIRDRNVTGVQTCALPILGVYFIPPGAMMREPGRTRVSMSFWSGEFVGLQARTYKKNWLGVRLKTRLRSEERRVGKECRSRWWRKKYEEKQ